MPVDQPRRTALLVIGMHRSGTSAMARTLALAGAVLPTDVMGAYRGNETGHWEPVAVAGLNDRMLAKLDAGWDDIFGPRRTRKGKLPLSRHMDEARRIIREQYGDSTLIVLKEPRLTLFVDFWEQALQAEGFECVYVIMVRRPEEVAASLRSRDQIGETHSLLLWATYMSQADLLTRKSRRLFCTYDRLLGDPEATLDAIEDQLGIELPRRTPKASAQIAAFLQPTLRHHASSSNPAFAAPLKPVGNLTDYLFDLASGNQPNEDVARATQEWLRSLDTLVSPLLVGEQLRAERAAAEKEEFRAKVEDAERRLEAQTAAEQEREALLKQRSAALADVQHRLVAMDAELEQQALGWRAEVDRLAAALVEAEKARAARETELGSAVERREAEAASRLAERGGRLKAEENYAAALAHVARSEAEHAVAQETIAQLRAERDSAEIHSREADEAQRTAIAAASDHAREVEQRWQEQHYALEARRATADAARIVLQSDLQSIRETLEVEAAARQAERAGRLTVEEVYASTVAHVAALEAERAAADAARAGLDAELQSTRETLEVEAAARHAERAGRLTVEEVYASTVAHVAALEAERAAADAARAGLDAELQATRETLEVEAAARHAERAGRLTVEEAYASTVAAFERERGVTENLLREQRVSLESLAAERAMALASRQETERAHIATVDALKQRLTERVADHNDRTRAATDQAAEAMRAEMIALRTAVERLATEADVAGRTTASLDEEASDVRGERLLLRVRKLFRPDR